MEKAIGPRCRACGQKAIMETLRRNGGYCDFCAVWTDVANGGSGSSISASCVV